MAACFCEMKCWRTETGNEQSEAWASVAMFLQSGAPGGLGGPNGCLFCDDTRHPCRPPHPELCALMGENTCIIKPNGREQRAKDRHLDH